MAIALHFDCPDAALNVLMIQKDAWLWIRKIGELPFFKIHK